MGEYVTNAETNKEKSIATEFEYPVIGKYPFTTVHREMLSHKEIDFSLASVKLSIDVVDIFVELKRSEADNERFVFVSSSKRLSKSMPINRRPFFFHRFVCLADSETGGGVGAENSMSIFLNLGAAMSNSLKASRISSSLNSSLLTADENFTSKHDGADDGWTRLFRRFASSILIRVNT